MLHLSNRRITLMIAGLALLLGTTAWAQNTAVGTNALFHNTTGTENSAFGASALFQNTTGSQNAALGANTLFQNTSGSNNTGIGFSALGDVTFGQSNVGLGSFAGGSLGTGNSNTALGSSALLMLRSGSNNIAIGLNTANNYKTTESNNVVISNPGVTGDNGVIRIGGTSQTSAFIAGISGATSSSGLAVFVNASGQLGTTTSSMRFKDDVQPMGGASKGLMQLQPVTFHYKPGVDDGSHILQYGLIAEDVAKVYPGLVQYDDNGKPLAVRYQFVNAMLLNEVQEQNRQLTAQQQRIEQLEQKVQELLQHSQR